MKLASYVVGRWVEGTGSGVEVRDAVYGRPVALVDSTGIDLSAAVLHARVVGGPNLRASTFHERAAMLRALASYLMERTDRYYELSFKTGATRRDGWIDIEGGIGTFFSYSSLARREMPNDRFLVEDEVQQISKAGSFVGRHILVPKEGVAVHINAFNFPCWGMLEKLAPTLLAGMPAIVKPATPSAYVAQAMAADIVASGILPEGALQLICGSVGDLLDVLDEHDVVTFTGSSSTGHRLKTHPNVIAYSIPFNLEADSLNCSILGETVAPEDPEFGLFVTEVVNETIAKAGQKCTAIRRVIVPSGKVDAVLEALEARLTAVTLGDPSREDVRMGPLVSTAQRREVLERVAELRHGSSVVLDGSREFTLLGGDPNEGGFMPPTLLYCAAPHQTAAPHDIEAFGPVATVMPYQGLDDAIALARRGRGSLAGSIVTYERNEASALFFGCASAHGRMLILNRDCAKENTGHGSPLPQLIHGGPGRAGAGEELGGVRAVKRYMQRCAVQTDPTTLSIVCGEYVKGAQTYSDAVHPFRKFFDELRIGETYRTARRTVTEADIINFATLTGDHFYAHMDDAAARASIFGRRVAHGYFLISAAAGLFVDPAPGPVLANYGLEDLRFTEPVGIGDTIQARLTVKRKQKREGRPGERPSGVVAWDVEITNQDSRTVAAYSVLTLVERKN
jgi:oxepin-CoA hydrolase/3-oxo-5,6-dehydrosuberyl-CoA semialdehyde dehydrogenase